DSPYWVPPIIKDELDSFDREKNPVFQNAEASFFLAYRDNRLVGRIAAIINWLEVRDQHLPKTRFGWFDFADDIEVSKTLLDKVGVLTEGFDQIGTMITWYNHPYYQSHYERLGFEPEKEYLESKFLAANADPKFFYKANLLVKRRYGLREMNFERSADIMPWVDKMFDLFNQTYSKLSSFVRITDAQKEFFKKKYIGFINPEYIKFVVDQQDKLVAFAIVMPSFSKALQKANGKLFPTGFIHLLHAKRNSKDVIFYLIGILPEYQNKGVTAIIF